MKRILLFIFAFILGLFVATNAFCQPVQEIDPRSIWKDGSKTTTARIPFAYGISMTPNIMIGVGALSTAGPGLTGAIAIGSNAGQTLYGDQSIAIGTNALQNTASGAGSATPNMAIGTNALRNLTTASNNLAYGYGALTTYTTSPLGGNIGIGNYALEGTSNAEATICIGYRCGVALTTHDSTVALGYNTLATMTSGGREPVAIGYESMSDMSGTTSIGNTAVGYGSMSNVDADYAVAIGYSAMWGDNLPTPAILGDGAVMIGYRAGQHLFGPYSVGIGYGALSGTQASGAANNVAIGKNSLAALTTGNNNVALGQLTGTALTTGSGNVFLGNNAGYYETGSSKLFIDNATRSNEADARTKALIYGVFNAATASQSLTINGLINATEGEFIPAGKKIYFGDTDTYISVEAPYGSVGFYAGSSGDWPVLLFETQDPTGYIRFSSSNGNSTTYDVTGVAHTLGYGSGLGVYTGLGDPLFSVFSHATTPAVYSYVPLIINPTTNKTNQFQVTKSDYTEIFNVDVSTPAITNSAKTNIAVTNANAFLVENGSGTDRFLVDTSTPKIDLLAPTNVGVAGTTAYNFDLHQNASGKGVFWRPANTGTNPQLEYAGKDGLTSHIKVSAANTATVSSWVLFDIQPSLSGTVGRGISLPINIALADSRTINASGLGFDAVRLFPMSVARSSGFSSNQSGTHQLAGLYMTFGDSGTYSISTGGVSYQAYGMTADLGGMNPVFSATSGSNTLTFSLLTATGGGGWGGGNAQTTLAFKLIDLNDTYTQISGFAGAGAGGTHYGIHYRPTVNVISGGALTEAALRADRSGIILASDGTKGTYSGGNLFMGASLDWERFYEADNEAVEDIPTGAVYDFRINSVDQMSLGLRSLTLGDNTNNDFNIAFDQTNDASIKWDSADETFYVRTNGAIEYLYPTYEAGVSITTYGQTSPTARYALQTWGIANAAFGTLGGYWGGFSEGGSSTGYSGNEVYGGTFYNYFTGTNARTIGSIFGNYVGNEFSVVSNLTATTIRGLYIGVLEGAGSLVTATDIISLDISKPGPTFTGAAPTNSYYIKTGNANTFATNNYGIFLGGATNTTYRAGTQAIWSSAASTLDITTNTTLQFKTGANPANGTAGTVGMTFNANGLGLGTAVSASGTQPFIISALQGTQRSLASLSYTAAHSTIGAWGGVSISATNTQATGSAAGTGLTVGLTHSLTAGAHTGISVTVTGASQNTSTARALNGNVTMNTASATAGQAQGGFLQMSSPSAGAAAGYILGLGRGASGAATNPNALDLLGVGITYLSNDTTGVAYGLQMIKGATVPSTAYTIHGFGHYNLIDDNTWDICSDTNGCRTGYFDTSVIMEDAAFVQLRASTQTVYSSAASTLDLDTNTTGNLRVGTTVEYIWNASKFDFQANIADHTAGKIEMPALTALPATCVQGEYVQDTDSDDCANTGGGDGAICVCKTTNTWALVANI